jgi:UDP-N-acetylglucosamine 2-epimerase (non-hydrolysing)
VIAVVYGTTGELIKLAPLLATLEGRGQPAFTVTTAQQVRQIPDSLRDFGLRQPDLWLRDRSTRDLEHRGQIPSWLADVARSFARSRRDVGRRLRQERSLLIVHGDTMTTLLGSLMGRTLGVPVGHIEAGMRSGDWRDPFPEEVIRRATSHIVKVHFAPGPKPVANLRAARVGGTIVDTGENTIRDSLELAATTADDAQIPAEAYGLVSLHRFELLERPERLRAILEVLSDAAFRSRMLFVDHPVTADAIRSNGLEPLFHDRFVRIPRRRYSGFVALVRRSRFLVTDSGGSQEECAYLGVPCLVHRGVTEHDTGLDGSVVLSRFDLDLVRRFLENPDRWRTEPRLPERSPTAVIVDFLESERLIAPA